MPGSDRPRVHVDFNDLDTDGRFFVLPDDVEGGVLGLRSEVVLVDEEGNSALGHVAELRERGRAIIVMAAGTWRSHEASVPMRPTPTRNIQQQVAQLLESSVQRFRSAAGWYGLSQASSGVITATAAPPSGRPEPRGAVPSSL